MDLILILTYTAFCVAIFKIFKIPLNKWSVPTAVLGGVILIGTLLMLMNYNHPYAEMARNYYISTPVVPLVRGRVIEVPVQGSSVVKKGDVLFKMDSTPYKKSVISLEARLTSAKEDMARAAELMRRGVGKQQDLDRAIAAYDDLEAQLDKAKFDLEQTTVYAPTDGYAVQMALKPGMVATPFMMRPVMTYVNMDENRQFVGWFWQNSMQRLKPGDEAEVVVNGIPGRVFKAKVTSVVPAIAAGNIQANSGLIDQATAMAPGRMPVTVEINDPEWDKYQVVPGSSGVIAIYTESFPHVSIIRRILLRMGSWMNYLFPFH